MLEIAERFAEGEAGAVDIFISHQGEEGGLLGSRWFVDHPRCRWQRWSRRSTWTWSARVAWTR